MRASAKKIVNWGNRKSFHSFDKCDTFEFNKRPFPVGLQSNQAHEKKVCKKYLSVYMTD